MSFATDLAACSHTTLSSYAGAFFLAQEQPVTKTASTSTSVLVSSLTSLQHLINISTRTHQQDPPPHPALPTTCPTTASDTPQLHPVQREIAPSTQSWNSCATHSPTWRARLPPSRIQSCTINSSASSCTRSTMPLGSCADEQPSSESGSKT